MSRLEIKELRNIERILYLQVLDNAWREHLYQMDILKTGIGLRGYNQKDPLVEYKKKVIIFSWSWLIVLIDSIKLLFSVQFNQEEVQI